MSASIRRWRARSCSWLERSFGTPVVRTVPIGIGATAEFLRELHGVLELELPAELAPGADGTSEAERRSRLPWYSKSVDSTYLTGKRVFIFADATHAVAAARVASKELGFEVVGLGSYSREQAREVRAAAKELGLEALISDDYLAVEKAMAEAAPELVLGTQMERHSAKRLGIPCAVISAPLHVQDVPARYSPQMGWEGANVLFDTWVHPLMMGLEEHLIGMFRHDFEFVDGHRSHLGDGAPSVSPTADAVHEARARLAPRGGGGSTGGRGGGGRTGVDRRRRGGAAQDPLLRARQGAAQHRDLRPRARPGRDQRRDAVRRQGPLQPLRPHDPLTPLHQGNSCH